MPQRENIDALKRALYDVFKDPELSQISADQMLGDYPAVEYRPGVYRFRSIEEMQKAAPTIVIDPDDQKTR